MILAECVALWGEPEQEKSSTHLISSASAVSSSLSVPECWAGPGNEATLVSRDYLNSCTSSTPCFLFFPGLTQPTVTVTFDSTFLSFHAPPLFAESFAGHFENTIVPYRRPLKLHFENFRMNYPLDSLQEHGGEKYKTS